MHDKSSSVESGSEAQRYGPVEAVCPHCGETFTVEAGPTPRADVVHEPDGCGEWLHVDMETGGTCEARL